MDIKQTGLLTFFDFPIKHFPDRSSRWLLEDGENVHALLEALLIIWEYSLSSVNLHISI